MPRLTIVTPVYNGEKYIEKTLQSVAAQTCKDFEYLILDGDSTDGTLRIIDRYRDVVTKVISRKDDGPLDAFNRAWPDMTGGFIMLLSSDDWIEPDAVEKIVEASNKNSKAEVIRFDMNLWQDTPQGMRLEAVQGDIDNGVLDIPGAAYGGCINHVLHRRLYAEYGLYEHDKWKPFADRELHLRFSLAEPVKAVIPKVLYHFRKHGGSTTGNGRADVTAQSMHQSLRMAYDYAKKPLPLKQRRQIHDWYGFCWVRAGYFLLRTGQVGEAAKLLVRGLKDHPAACLRRLINPAMPKVYKPKTA